MRSCPNRIVPRYLSIRLDVGTKLNACSTFNPFISAALSPGARQSRDDQIFRGILHRVKYLALFGSVTECRRPPVRRLLFKTIKFALTALAFTRAFHSLPACRCSIRSHRTLWPAVQRP